jgi:hypothetical protein
MLYRYLFERTNRSLIRLLKYEATRSTARPITWTGLGDFPLPPSTVRYGSRDATCRSLYVVYAAPTTTPYYRFWSARDRSKTCRSLYSSEARQVFREGRSSASLDTLDPSTPFSVGARTSPFRALVAHPMGMVSNLRRGREGKRESE